MNDAAKYDALAPCYTGRYADADAVASHQVKLLREWGPRLSTGDTVIELGSADGFVTERLLKHGLEVTAIDLSPAMVEQARRRLTETAVGRWSVMVADVNDLPELHSDAVLATMWTFFAYAHDPLAVLGRLRQMATKKVIVDCNPRSTAVRSAMDAMEAAGFRDVRWRPFFVPQTRRLIRPIRSAAEIAERTPLLRSLPLRWRFTAVIQGRP